MTDSKALINITNLSKVYRTDGSQTHALRDIDLTIFKGDYVTIQGPSGGGKSTLLSIIGLLDKASSGDYQISDVSVAKLSAAQMAKVRNREIGFIFQDFNLIGDMTVSQNVELPLIYRGVSKAIRKEKVAQVLKRVNMSERARHLPNQLSGGQQQRVAVARALVGSPTLLLADEPTGNLDSVNGDSVMQLLTELNEQGVTICMVTHDSRYAHFAKRTVNLFDGEVISNSINIEPHSSEQQSREPNPQNIAELMPSKIQAGA
ncbi:ABC transporter ATP-binding protein [Thalassotalea sp. ND16A]|uniref:ABC transporter ATP-binding protein n=1 Tax=Thalassotalea sp. ND16A TaxID=1535422 RepID=UPI00051CE09C|nr:ABC transporter ATP-binding protein [Thalassotalea sp. ND16A]KGJ95846.1 Phosphonate-transporting ATPase [Thalassotalea sp. ND16A]